ncbi:hypothetical protein, partial [Paracoccus sp. FO-3]|uniref:hypothetical protein n=1 Tax=Paracoccus sp. FO-3 TaxID=1335059 RepID=UPI001C612050
GRAQANPAAARRPNERFFALCLPRRRSKMAKRFASPSQSGLNTTGKHTALAIVRARLPSGLKCRKNR